MYRDYVLNALYVYLNRGRRILQLLNAEKYDEAQELFDIRKAGFYNFFTLDELALRFENYDVSSDEDGIKLWNQIKALDAQLQDKIIDVKRKLQHELKRLLSFKHNVSKYKSYQVASNELISEI